MIMQRIGVLKAAIALVAGCLAGAMTAGAAVEPEQGMSEVPFNQVQVEDAFWSPWIATVQETTIPHVLELAEKQGKIDNLRIIAGRKKKGRIRKFNSPDSDLWKIMEAASYTLAWRVDPQLERKLDDLIELYAAAQAEDGYINQMYMLPDDHPQSPRKGGKWSNLGHGADLRFKGSMEQWPWGIGQLYVAGHLFESAAAHYRATGKRSFLDIAVKMADCLYRELPPGEPIEYADHPQAGIGLIKLYEVTGEEKYLELANHIVHHGNPARPNDLGEGESARPLKEQRKAWGHAVRINYLYSAGTDLCRYLEQPETRTALDSLWHSIVDRRIYLHGGVGGPAGGEQLSDDWKLNPFTTYSECCANIAHGQWNHRLNLLIGNAKYADLVEIEAYNGALSGINLKGNKYFYSNPLSCNMHNRRGRHHGVRESYLFCCPSKLPGFVAGIGRWIYAKDSHSLYVNLFIGGTVATEIGGERVEMEQQTEYPWQGKTRLTLQSETPDDFDICLRVPGWVRTHGPMPTDLYRFAEPRALDWQVRVNGKRLAEPRLENGYVRISRHWRKGDTVSLELSMPVRQVHSHPNVEPTKDKVALMRGPLVYALEGCDNDFNVLRAALADKPGFKTQHESDLLGGVTAVEGTAVTNTGKRTRFTAIPYYAWQNRGVHQMTAWLYKNSSELFADADSVKSDPDNLATQGIISASVRMSTGIPPNSLNALRDGQVPESSADKSQARMAWWPRKGGKEWVQCRFEKPREVEKVEVYWFADCAVDGNEGCALPASWRLLYLDNGAWKEVPDPGDYEIKPDGFVELEFKRVVTPGLRVEVQLHDGLSGGIHEWRIPTVWNIDG